MNLKKILYTLAIPAIALIAANSNKIKSCAKETINEIKSTQYTLSPEEMKTVPSKKIKILSEKELNTLEKKVKAQTSSIKNIDSLTKKFGLNEAIIYSDRVLKYEYDSIQYGKNYWAPLKTIHKTKKDDCDGGAIAAAALLQDDGFPPYILWLKSKKDAHVVFLYKTDKGEYGSIGINHNDCQYPQPSIKDLIKKINKKFYNDPKKRYTEMIILNMEEAGKSIIYDTTNLRPTIYKSNIMEIK